MTVIAHGPHIAVPDAIAALVAAVIQANPDAEPERIGRLVQAELEWGRWHVGVPGSCRPTRPAAAGRR